MKRVLMIAIVIVLLAAGGFAALQGGRYLGQNSLSASAEAQGTEGEVSATEGIDPTGKIVVDARVVPVQEAQLSLPVSGIVDAILVQEGDQVVEGQVLLRLHAARQKVAVSQAQAELQRAQARLQELIAGARPEEVASAQAALDAAQAQLDRVQGASLPGQIKAAEAALAAAQAGLQKVLEGADEQAIIAARADLANADAARRQAQNAYNEVKWRNDIGALPQAAQLEQATNNFEAAQARLNELVAGPSGADVANARALVNQAQAQLDTLRDSMPSDIEVAAATMRQAESQLNLLKAGTRSETIEVAQADVAAVTSALQQALVALAETELVAPFSGTVATINVSVGEQATPGVPVLWLANLATWQIKTEDLTELDVTAIRQEAPVNITFDALPGLAVPGNIRFINPLGADNRGDIVYTATIDPGSQDARLLWNMTAVVEFEVK